MNQHFVPRVYLQNFADKKGKEFYVNVFDKKENKYFYPNIRNICTEKDIYTLDYNSIVSTDQLGIEKAYGDFIEPTYRQAYDVLTNNKVKFISNQDRANIIVGILHLYHRNTSYLNRIMGNHMKNIKRRYLDAIMKKQKGLTYLREDYSFKEWTFEQIESHVKSIVIKMFKETHFRWTKEMAELHEFSIIQVDIVKDYSNYMTSDNPLMLNNLFAMENDPFSKATDFSIPINKKILVTIFHDKTKRVNQIYRYYTQSGNVNMTNQVLFSNSTRFVIGDKNTFQDLKEHQPLFTDTSIERKMQMIEQIVTNRTFYNQNPEYFNLIESYYKKYKAQGKLSDLEVYRMKMQMDDIAKKSKLEKIK